LKQYQSLGLIGGTIAKQIKVQGLVCKKRRKAGVQLQFIQGLDYTISKLQ
jgi:hypothetical protein